MPNLNKVQLMGNITRDPEVRYTPKGTAVTDIGLAINRNFTGDDGERREETTFVDITFWGRQAEVIGEYMKKGRPLYVEGRLQLDTWEDKASGQQRSRLKVIGEGFQFLGGRDDAGGGGGPRGGSAPSSHDSEARGHSGGGHSSGGQSRPAQVSPPAQNSYQDGPIEDDDDIPF